MCPLETCKTYRHIGRVEIELHSFFHLADLLSGKEPPVPIKWEVGWAPEIVQEKKLSHTRIELRFLDLTLLVIFSQSVS
jgi:hypothetical protein